MHRLLYEKTGNARWISHLDMVRMFQRSFLRAGIAIKHSSGYHPHAVISIAMPLSVGQESICELMDFEMIDGTPCAEVPERLNAVFPDGLRALRCYESSRKIHDLALLRACITLEYDRTAPEPGLIAALFARPELTVEKHGKNGPTELDIQPLIQEIAVRPCADGLQLDAVIAAQNPSLNPELLVSAIRRYLPEAAPDFARILRLDVLDRDGESFR